MYQPSERANRQARAQAMARGLGWFSIALGVAEMVAPGSIKRNTGVPGPGALVQAYGLREIATGLAILASDRPVTMVWGRVAGDVLDLATLAPTLGADNPRRAGGAGALAFVIGATLIDVYVASQGDDGN